MQLYLDSPGSFLHIRQGMFAVRPKHSAEHLFALADVRCIHICKGVRLSSDALFAALENNIPVLLTQRRTGRALGHVWTGQYGSISTIRKQQALFAERIEGLYYIAERQLYRCVQQEQLLQAAVEAHPLVRSNVLEIQKQQRQLQKAQQPFQTFLKQQPKGDLDALRGQLRGWEGAAARSYFIGLSYAVPQAWTFEKRSRRPAYDAFNSLLNYLYGMLYGQVELACIKAGLDPYIGILHTDRHQRPTFVYDCIESYRHWAEQIALQLVWGDLKTEHFDHSERGGYWLAQRGKGIVIAAYQQYLAAKILHRGRQRKRQTCLELDLIRLARNFAP